MARKMMSLKDYLLRNLATGESKRVKGIIGMLTKSEDFITVLSLLSGQDKDRLETIQYYEVLLGRFRSNSHLVNDYISNKEWHNWTEVLIEMSNVLWKWRDKFEPNMWLKTNAKIYEVAFGNFKDDEKYSEEGLCFMCSRLFTEILRNFACHAREGDKTSDFHISSEKIQEISTLIGTRPEHMTHYNLIKEKISEYGLLKSQ